MAVAVNAYGGGGYSGSGGYGGNGGGYAGNGGGYAGNGGGYGGGSASLAVYSNHNVNYRPVSSRNYNKPTNVYVDSTSAPVNFVFRSSSGPMYVQQQHQPGGGSYLENHSEDAP
ncbi:hypothetical protein BLA29_014444, partial [Euroglyphus maynei]